MATPLEVRVEQVEGGHRAIPQNGSNPPGFLIVMRMVEVAHDQERRRGSTDLGIDLDPGRFTRRFVSEREIQSEWCTPRVHVGHGRAGHT